LRAPDTNRDAVFRYFKASHNVSVPSNKAEERGVKTRVSLRLFALQRDPALIRGYQKRQRPYCNDTGKAG